MFNKLFSKQLQKGLSLIEASIVLVLSAVVVAGVMVYYQTAQNNNRLEKASAQIMHIVSEINGLYAGVKYSEDGIYAGLNVATLLSAVSDLKSENVQGSEVIKTSIPDVYLNVGAELDKNFGHYNRFFITLVSPKKSTISQICQRFVALNFGGQVDKIFMVQNAANQYMFDASSPFSDKLAGCQKLDGGDANMVGLLFK